ncbi:GNAT family N-acetyltransferase [Sporosarcina sp. ANT_H38]|uniref:GNAT family N-acetyltransferase n=1 Tax=Sporosarcina sp. ANT_H38 TaxID=2597358 RepID=UPI0011F28A3C|nr:GNAT family N-acetyltransferase [Sporosarcina sp. ANT_H38]KAA0955421.1 GNAT family N-acetyltransferase [Sporosarcina sp. ANT_H38]
MNITQFNKKDTEEIVHLFYDTVHTINAKDYSKEQLDAWVHSADLDSKIESWSKSLNENVTYVAKINNKIVGFGDLTNDGVLDRLYVHKNYQRKGIASALLQKLELEALKLHKQGILTYASVTAKPFFESHGYTLISTNHVERKGITLTNFVMKKN